MGRDTKNSLGYTFRNLGERETGSKKLHDAVDALQNALQESARERVPFKCAMTQHNLGLAFCSLAAKSKEESTLAKGSEAIRAALEIFEMSQATYYIDTSKSALAEAETLLEEIRPKPLS